MLRQWPAVGVPSIKPGKKRGFCRSGTLSVGIVTPSVNQAKSIENSGDERPNCTSWLGPPPADVSCALEKRKKCFP